jgi:outer membrane protein OmpA-like peptidoglycan-associated protein
MTRHPIRPVLLSVAGLALAACAARTAPPREPVAVRHTAPAPGQVVKVRVAPGTIYAMPRPAQPGTTYVVEVEHDPSQLQASQADLARTQRELAAARQAREQAQRERDAALARVREIAKLEENDRGLVIALSGTVMFRHDEAILLPEARTRLDRVADALKHMAPDQKIVIEGHADARGTDEYNLRLSEERANAVRTYLLQRGVAPDRVDAVGRGEAVPFAPNRTAEGRANNRRVEIVISPSQAASAG